MTANTFVVRLIDVTGSSGGMGADAADVGQSLTGWFRSLCQTATSGATTWTADVQWLTEPPSSNPSKDAGSPQTINLIVFFVPAPGSGVIRLHKDFRGIELPAEKDAAVWGTTVVKWTPPAAKVGSRKPDLGIAEVYISRCRGSDAATNRLNMARIAFHESMHNLLVRNGEELHRGNLGFAAATPTGTAPTAENLKLLAAGMGTLVPQWLDGFQAWRSNSHDPLGI